jgi:hypothetical protein
MKTLVFAVAAACVAAPAFAQIGDADIDALMKRYVALFNKADAAALASEVYANGDPAAMAAKIDSLRKEEFGRLDVYGFKPCPVAGDKTQVEMRYGKLFTYGGLMNGDEVKVFDLTRTPAGWRISGETDTKFDSKLSCS